jgi:hypothetical protein
MQKGRPEQAELGYGMRSLNLSVSSDVYMMMEATRLSEVMYYRPFEHPLRPGWRQSEGSGSLT